MNDTGSVQQLEIFRDLFLRTRDLSLINKSILDFVNEERFNYEGECEQMYDFFRDALDGDRGIFIETEWSYISIEEGGDDEYDEEFYDDPITLLLGNDEDDEYDEEFYDNPITLLLGSVVDRLGDTAPAA